MASCLVAFSSTPLESTLLPAHSCKLVEEAFCRLYLQLECSTISAAKLHTQNLASSDLDWKRLRNSRTCLVCLRRSPEHVLQCSHSLCDICVCVFGNACSEMEYTYQLSHCPLCLLQLELKVRLKPPTAGTRLLVLDGGGIRGAFTLRALRALEQSRKLPYPVYDEFDLSLGTSSGK
jgi:hypothetical protein